MYRMIKAYFFIPSGMKSYIEHGFEGWGIFYFIYFGFCGLLSYEAGTSLQIGLYLFLQTLALLALLVIFSSGYAFIMGAKEPLIKALRLVGLCLPPIGLIIFFLTRKSLLVFFAFYPILLFIYGSAFVGRRRLLNAAVGMITIAVIAAGGYSFARVSDRWFGLDLAFDGYKAELSRAQIFGKDESKIYRYLLFSTPDLGHIPQADEIADSLRLDGARVQDALLKLDEKGCIVLGADREIRYAYPWAMYDQGYEVLIQKTGGTATGHSVYAASALHALSAANLFRDCTVRILGRLSDTGEMLVIEIKQGQIGSTNHPEAQIYKSEIQSQMEFYSSPAGAKASYRGRYDSTRLLSLDRAIVVAYEDLQKIAPGIIQEL
jgi:hypothetical protein